MIQKSKSFNLPAFLFTVVLLFSSFHVYGQEIPEPSTNTAAREIVFLLDASNSMNELETNVATQAVRMMAHCLTSDFMAGFVSFNTKVQSVCSLNNDLTALDRAAGATVFTGYSNTGEGLEMALSLFSDGESVNRSIVLVSDGEIIMATEKETQESTDRFQAAVADAVNRGITVHTLMIADESKMAEASVLDASVLTGGGVHWANGRDDIRKAAEEILFTDLGIHQSTVAAGGAQNGRLNIDLPDTEMSRAKILLVSDFPFHNVTAAANARDVLVTTGERFAVVDLDAPTQTGVSVAFDAVAYGNVHAKLILEYAVVLHGEITYPPMDANNSAAISEPPVITVSASGTGKTGVLWRSPIFDGKDIVLHINGEKYTAELSDGHARVLYEGMETDQYMISADFSEFLGNFLSVAPAEIQKARPVIAPPPGPDYRPLIVILILMAIALVLVLLTGKRRTVRRDPLPPTGVLPEKSEKKTHNQFSGKLNLYVTHMPDDSDIPPQSFNLYRENREKMRLHYVLAICGIRLGDVDDREIELRPGQDGALEITNKSSATVLKNRDLILKGQTFTVHFEEKVTITFSNNSEVVMHYKNVKPSERV